MGKPSSTISATQVHKILQQFRYEFVPAPHDRELKKVAKDTAKNFPGVKLSREGDCVYFRYAGEDGRGATDEFFVKAKGMLLVNTLTGIEKITGIKFAEHIN